MAMRVIRASDVDVRRLWADEERTLSPAAAVLGMSVSHCRHGLHASTCPHGATGAVR